MRFECREARAFFLGFGVGHRRVSRSFTNRRESSLAGHGRCCESAEPGSLWEMAFVDAQGALLAARVVDLDYERNDFWLQRRADTQTSSHAFQPKKGQLA